MTTPLSGRQHAFTYDAIGNRKSSNSSGRTDLADQYWTNALNQYTSRENNTLAAGGVADPAARVAAGAYAQTNAGRAGNHWGDNVVMPNANGPYFGPFDVFALKSGAGSGGADLLKKETKTAMVAASLQSFTYDDDGNMLSDGIWTYSWDGENRLTSLTATALAVAGGYPNLQLEFKYDYLGRRVEKKVTRLGANGGVIDWRRFLYDGWSMVAEYTVSGSPTVTLTLTRSYTWGLDIARSLKDAGGVGALLQITDTVSTKTYLPTYDGNGNIVSLANGSTGALAAVYEYSPFGEHLRAETIDSAIAGNPFRFSTKYYDTETGLYDYGRRYYNSRDGRFVGRDPTEEKGGLHLFAFCLNNPVNMWDVLGEEPSSSSSKSSGSNSKAPQQDNVQFAHDGSGSSEAAAQPSAQRNADGSYIFTDVVRVGGKVVGTNQYNNTNEVVSFQTQAGNWMPVGSQMINDGGMSLAPTIADSWANIDSAEDLRLYLAFGKVMTKEVAKQFYREMVLAVVGTIAGGAVEAAGSMVFSFAGEVRMTLNPASLANNEARLILIRNGEIVRTEGMDAMLTHRDFAKQNGALAADGSLAEGYWIGTIVRDGDSIFAFNSKTFYENQNINADATLIGRGMPVAPPEP